MSFTFEQCRRFKEWGYPQDNASFVWRVVVRGGKPIEIYVVGFHREENDVAIPTLAGVMEWLANIVGNRYIELKVVKFTHEDKSCFRWQVTYDEWWYDCICPYAALYNLAEKVKG